MPYTKTNYRQLNIADMPRAALDNIENALDLGYHVLSITTCAQIMEILGNVAAFWPFFESVGNMSQDFGPNGYHLYVNTLDDLDAWDEPPEGQGIMRAYCFNGVDEYMNALDQDAFTVEATDPFTLGAWVYLNVAADNAILSKWDETTAAEKREWLFCTDNTGYLTMIVYDETNNATIAREYQTTLPTNIWVFVVARYDGGTDAANIDVLVNAVEVDDATPADDAGFASMVNQTTVVRCGSYEAADGSEEYLFDGRMWGPFFTLKDLSDDEIWNLYQIGRGVLGLDLIGGQPK